MQMCTHAPCISWNLGHRIAINDHCPQKRKSHNQADDSSKQGLYQEFDEDNAQAWKALISLYIEKASALTDVNGRSCRQGFVKNLVHAAARVTSVLQIFTCLDINNEVRRIRSKCEAAMTVQREVLLSESFALLKPSTTIMACSASVTLSSMSYNIEEDNNQELLNRTPSSGLLASSGLNLLATVAAKSNYPQ